MYLARNFVTEVTGSKSNQDSIFVTFGLAPDSYAQSKFVSLNSNRLTLELACNPLVILNYAIIQLSPIIIITQPRVSQPDDWLLRNIM